MMLSLVSSENNLQSLYNQIYDLFSFILILKLNFWDGLFKLYLAWSDFVCVCVHTCVYECVVSLRYYTFDIYICVYSFYIFCFSFN